jgi:hypothetical protein
MDQIAVEYRALALVLVQTEPEILAQKRTALRRAESISVLQLPGARVVPLGWFVAEKTREVAGRQKLSYLQLP